MLEVCEEHGFDTSSWLGKANSFVDRRGEEPSYGYFLVDYTTIQAILQLKDTSPGYVAMTGSYKVDLRIVYDEKEQTAPNQPLERKERLIQDLYTESFINITPSLSSQESFYVLKVVDARFVFSNPEASENGLYSNPRLRWFNKVEVVLDPAQLKDEYELDTEPELTQFIYDEESLPIDLPSDEYITIGVKDGLPVKRKRPFTWHEIFLEILVSFCDSSRAETGLEPVFPYFEKNEDLLELDSSSVTFPLFTPQDITTGYKSAALVLRQLLFWTCTSLLYLGQGKFKLVPIENNDDPDSGLTELGTQLLPYENASDIKFTQVTTATAACPESIELNYPILQIERKNNEKQEYTATLIKVLDGVPVGEDSVFGRSGPVSRKVVSIVAPCVATDRGDTSSSLPESEKQTTIDAFYASKWKANGKYFSQYPPIRRSYFGFLDIRPSSYIERVSIVDLGDGPYTHVESLVPIEDWSWIEPKPFIPREQKFSVIIAKVDVMGEEFEAFSFKEPFVLVGDGPFNELYEAYNTFKQHYAPGEQVVLVKGYEQEWRGKSKLKENENGDPILWYTIDTYPYLRLKVHKDDLTPVSDGFECDLDKLVLVNGRYVLEEDESTPGEKIHITNDPDVLYESEDSYVYIAYDITVGNSVFSHWTTADASNFRLFLKGLPNYTTTKTTDAPLVLTTPVAKEGGGEYSLAWRSVPIPTQEQLEEQVTEIVINYLNENGGGGGTDVSILKANVNMPGGVTSTTATLNFNNVSVVLHTGNPPTAGAADNTYLTPFLHQEPVLLIKKSNGVYTAVKIQENIITATVALIGGTNGSTTDFDIGNIITLLGTTPEAGQKGAGDGAAYAFGERLKFIHGNDNKWHAWERTTSAMFRTTTAITAAQFDGTTLTIGQGTARMFIMSTIDENKYTISTSNTLIKNMVGTSIASSKNIQCKRIGKHWFVDVENCGG